MSSLASGNFTNRFQKNFLEKTKKFFQIKDFLENRIFNPNIVSLQSSAVRSGPCFLELIVTNLNSAFFFSTLRKKRDGFHRENSNK